MKKNPRDQVAQLKKQISNLHKELNKKQDKVVTITIDLSEARSYLTGILSPTKNLQLTSYEKE